MDEQALLAEIDCLGNKCAMMERSAIMCADSLERIIIAMQAAVIECGLTSPQDGMDWIMNTLDGPGNLPDMEDAQAIGSAQAWFDREIAKHEAFRAAHPMPEVPAAVAS